MPAERSEVGQLEVLPRECVARVVASEAGERDLTPFVDERAILATEDAVTNRCREDLRLPVLSQDGRARRR